MLFPFDHSFPSLSPNGSVLPRPIRSCRLGDGLFVSLLYHRLRSTVLFAATLHCSNRFPRNGRPTCGETNQHWATFHEPSVVEALRRASIVYTRRQALLFLDKVFAQKMYSARATLDAFVLHHRCLGDRYKVPRFSLAVVTVTRAMALCPRWPPRQHAPLPSSAWPFEPW